LFGDAIDIAIHLLLYKYIRCTSTDKMNAKKLRGPKGLWCPKTENNDATGKFNLVAIEIVRNLSCSHMHASSLLGRWMLEVHSAPLALLSASERYSLTEPVFRRVPHPRDTAGRAIRGARVLVLGMPLW